MNTTSLIESVTGRFPAAVTAFHTYRGDATVVVRPKNLVVVARFLKEDPDFEKIAGYVEDSGEGRWTVEESIELSVPTPVISASLQARFRSRQDQPFGARLLAAMRSQFGGHSVKPAAKEAEQE